MSSGAGNNLFTPGYRSIWRISYPLMLAGISETIIDITDTIFLARYGLTELAAIGLADAWFMLFMFLSLGLVDGIQIIVSRRTGENREREAGRVFNQGLYLLTIVSVVMTGLILLVLALGAGDLLASQDVAHATESYLRIAAFSLLFQSLNLAFGTFFVAIARTRILIGAALVLAISNVALDYALIFGNFGLPEMGIEGAAVASLTAEILACLFLAGSIYARGFNTRFGLLRFDRWNSAISKRLVNISWPVALDTLVDLLRWFLLSVQYRSPINYTDALIDQAAERPYLLRDEVAGPERLGMPLGRLGDHAIRDFQNGRRAAVVLLEPVGHRAREVLVEVQHVLDAGAAPRVDRLVVVADDAEVGRRGGQQPDEAVLLVRGVLELVDHEVAQSLLQGGAQLGGEALELALPVADHRGGADDERRAGAVGARLVLAQQQGNGTLGRFPIT